MFFHYFSYNLLLKKNDLDVINFKYAGSGLILYILLFGILRINANADKITMKKV